MRNIDNRDKEKGENSSTLKSLPVNRLNSHQLQCQHYLKTFFLVFSHFFPFLINNRI